MTNSEFGENVVSSFRDPSGFLFYKGGFLYRQVNRAYKEHYDHLMASGLYKDLVDASLVIPHEEVSVDSARGDLAYKVIRPEAIPFISYPYEWSFSQLRDAALAMLNIQKRALEHGMSLKDSSAYNIQFRKGAPLLIDTLSFEKYREGQPWIAYRQFCQHFLAPLALMSYRDIRLGQLLRIYIDGIPLDLASSLLPARTRFAFSLFSHIHLHARCQEYFSDKVINRNGRAVSRRGLAALIDNLESAVGRLKWDIRDTEWSNYYYETNYAPDALNQKKQLVAGFLEKINPKMVWDLGANTGLFSRIAGDKGIDTICFDADPACVEKNYRECVKSGETHILPLVLDLTNPSPGIGWENRERSSFLERGPADAALALALIHHLAIFNNLPFKKIAAFFANICSSLIIEFVPKNDSQAQRLLSSREDIFPDYTESAFEGEFTRYFSIQDSAKIKDTERTLYLMRKR